MSELPRFDITIEHHEYPGQSGYRKRLTVVATSLDEAFECAKKLADDKGRKWYVADVREHEPPRSLPQRFRDWITGV